MDEFDLDAQNTLSDNDSVPKSPNDGDSLDDARTIGEPELLQGRYRVLQALGGGSMSEILLAEDTKLNNIKVILKMLPGYMLENEAALAQLKMEAESLFQLTHSNIIALRDFVETESLSFLVMDYIDGVSLDNYIVQNGVLGDAAVMKIFTGLASALDYAHSQGIIHRDIKPSNILIDELGHAFISDFGISNLAINPESSVATGTLPYLSPEQLRGEAPDNAQDIYSFAASMYEVISGKPPFHQGNIPLQIENKAPDPLASAFNKKILLGLSKDPVDRPGSCQDLLDVKIKAAGAAKKKKPIRALSVIKAILGLIILGAIAYGLYMYSTLKTLENRTEIQASDAGRIESNMQRVKNDMSKYNFASVDQLKPGSKTALAKQKRLINKYSHTIVKTGGETRTRQMKNLFLDMVLPKSGITFRLIPGGYRPPYAYTGKNEANKSLAEGTSFFMSTYETTQEQWKRVMGDNPSIVKGAKLPVTNVSYEDCINFIVKLTELEGLQDGLLRLPKEKTWEYACQGGTISGVYANELDDCAWYGKNSGMKLQEVGQKLPNAWGLYDMLGNAREICRDKAFPRGGSFKGFPDELIANPKRPYGSEEKDREDRGFRLVLKNVGN